MSYLDAVWAGERQANHYLDRALEHGDFALSDVFLHVLPEAQITVGDLWERGAIGVADEHRATEICLHQLERLQARLPAREPIGRLVIAAGVEGNLHNVALRIFARLMQSQGWEAHLMAPPFPQSELVRYAAERRPDLVALSISMAEQVSAARSTIRELKNLDLKVIVGGPAGILSEINADFTTSEIGEGLRYARELAGVPGLAQVLKGLGSRIRQLRSERGLSQEVMAELSGLNRAYLSQLEQGRQNPTVTVLYKLSSALDVPLAGLL